MGLLPLEFTECLQDSPYFRDSLHSHEKELERTSQNIKDLIKEVKNLINAAKALSACQRRLSQLLIDFKFECIGNNQTDDEIIIAGSLKEFGKLIAVIEDEKDRMLERAFEQFIEPLENFRKEQIGSVKERKKKFEKQTAKFCASQERYLGLSTKKPDNIIKEADAFLEMEQRDFNRAALEYVCLIQEVQEKKKFEFVETLLGFMYGWLTFYHQGHEVATDFKPHMTELQSRIQKTRENFNASREDIQALMRKMLEVRNSKPIDPGSLNRIYTRSGYLYVMEKKALTTTWNKCYCQYVRSSRVFCMIPYSQTTGKMVSNESFRLKTCIRRVADSIDKRFCFDITAEDKPGIVWTLQAQSEEDRRLWLEALDGKEPMFVHPPKPSNADQSYLDEGGFSFITRCFSVLESRGLEDQGLYRVVGVSSKVTKLLTMGLDKRKSEKLNLDDPLEWESKTITSAIKTYFRNLPEPIMTFKSHFAFIAAAKLETYQKRVNEVQKLVQQLPEPNKRMLELLSAHLEKVAENSKKNKMTVSNLGVCFGPTLLRAEEETVAGIMDIKFGNVVVEILVENWKHIIRGDLPAPSPRRSSSGSQLTVLPIGAAKTSPHVVSPSHRPPPPYHPPPQPPHGAGGGATLAHAVIYNNGPKQVTITNRSPPGGSGSQSSTSSSYNTWERTLRGGGSSTNLVPPPLGSAPPPSSLGGTPTSHRTVHASLSNLNNPPSEGNHDSSWYRNPTSKIPAKVGSRQFSTPGSSGAIQSLGPPNLNKSNHQQQSSSSSSMESLHSVSSSNKDPSVSPKSGSTHRPSSGTSPNSKLLLQLQAPQPPSKVVSTQAQARSLHQSGSKSSLSPTELRKVRTLYACVGEHETELSFEPNQIITSIRPSLEPGWLEGCLDGKVGLVPENYVEYIS